MKQGAECSELLQIEGPRDASPRSIGSFSALVALAVMLALGATELGRSTPAALTQWTDRTYARSATGLELRGLSEVARRYCNTPRDYGSGQRVRLRCKITRAEMGRERSSSPFARDVRGWGYAIGGVLGPDGEICDSGCAIVLLARRISAQPLKMRLVSFFGPTGGTAGSCYALYRGGAHYPGGDYYPPVKKWSSLPGAVVWAFRPVCSIEPGRTVWDFYR
jgi:hypothetical protein